MENRDSVIYKGSKTCYLYFDTSWEKESWCRALRLASSDEGKRNWYTLISEDFLAYLSSFGNKYPSFLKPSVVFSETTDISNKINGSSRVRLFWKKKLAKKASKNGIEYRASFLSSSNYVEKNIFEKLHCLADISIKNSSGDRSRGNSFQNNTGQHVPPTSTHSGNKGLRSSNSDATVDEKFVNDEGFDIGSLPPYIHRMRVLPTDLNEVWSMDLDLEYSGGILVDIETRLEVW